MPMVSRLQAASVQGRTQRAQAGVDPALDQRGDAKREHHREADVARVEERRVDGQRRVLQQRIERVALDRRVGQARQRVRGEHRVAEEEHAQQRPGWPPPRPSARTAGRRRRAPSPRRSRSAPGTRAASSPRGCPRRRRSCRSAACRCASWPPRWPPRSPRSRRRGSARRRPPAVQMKAPTAAPSPAPASVRSTAPAPGQAESAAWASDRANARTRANEPSSAIMGPSPAVARSPRHSPDFFSALTSSRGM